jgi:hypothetical protein
MLLVVLNYFVTFCIQMVPSRLNDNAELDWKMQNNENCKRFMVSSKVPRHNSFSIPGNIMGSKRSLISSIAI